MSINNQTLLIANSRVPDTSTSQPNKSGSKRIAWSGVGMTLIALLLSATIGLVSSEAHAANLLFKSNFGAGVTLGAPYIINSKLGWQDIIGTDSETGYSWPITALGANKSSIQLITYDEVTAETINDHSFNEIQQVTGPNGNLVNALYQEVKKKGPVGIGSGTGSQSPLMLRRPWTIGDIGDLYISYWFKHPTTMPNQLDNTVSSGNWLMQFQFKTGGYNNTSGGDARISQSIIKSTVDGNLYWRTNFDNVANSEFPKVIYWEEFNTTVAVPVGEWFKYEAFIRRSSGSDGRFWTAVNGQKIVDRWGANMGDFNLPLTRLMITSHYSGGHASIHGLMTGLEIWDGFPCGAGVSCYDKVAPSAPASLNAAVTSSQTNLSWGASTDNVAVTGYNIYRNGVKIGTSTETSFSTFNSLVAGVSYNYTVRAYDATGNLSASSNTVTVTK
ncbi:MAG: fibronectin type III domain-containing protein [Nitrosomonas sp.]|nr:fibronectin type III domain-containing protein [Nitrosomonas sp.]MDP1951987.1 fibronectin type III domain-containing protein [Nitrosomonas sp.]